jgi:hypothetical protein
MGLMEARRGISQVGGQKTGRARSKYLLTIPSIIDIWKLTFLILLAPFDKEKMGNLA